jgi:DNA repair protein RadC
MRNRLGGPEYGAPVSTPRDPAPSPEDVAVTRQLVEAGKLLDIEVLDHLVVGQQRFVSLRERGLGFLAVSE